MTWSAPARRAFRYDPLMFVRLRYLLGWVISVFRSREELLLENLALRQQLLALSLLAYNLGNLWRRLGLPRGIENWSLTSLQQRLVKTGGRLVKHARYYWLLLAEGHLNRRRFGAMLGRIALLPVLTG